MPSQGSIKKRPNERQQEIMASFTNTRRSIPLLAQGRIFFGGSWSQFGWMWLTLPMIGFLVFTDPDQRPSDNQAFLFVGAFLLVGLVSIAIDMRKNIRSIGLLQYGNLAVGRLKKVQRTNTEINNRRVYKYLFSFIASDGIEYDLELSTHRSDLVEDEGQELIIYNPQNPVEAIVFDTIPGNPMVNDQGMLEVDSPLLSLACLIFPGINFFLLIRMLFALAQ